MSKLTQLRAGYHSVTPRLVVADVAAQVEFLRRVFHATGEVASGVPSDVHIGDSLVMVSEAGERDRFPAFCYVYVQDADAAYARAVAAGASTIEPPLDTPYGDRRAMVQDPFGNVFQIAHQIEVDSATAGDPKEDLHHYLRLARDALLWKLDGLTDYDVRRPMTPTGTNLLGLVKHVASLAAGYFGLVFGRPFDERLPWYDEAAEPNADMYAAADESREQIVGLYHRVWAHADATIGALSLDTVGHVPHWPEEHQAVTLQLVLGHMIAETNRHAGHADIIRELIDGAVGHRADNDNMAPGDASWWMEYRDRLERTARRALGTN